MNCRVIISVLAICLMALAATAQADVSIEMVTVGDPGNAMDDQYEEGWNYGAVDYEYQIGKYELKFTEFVPFLNAQGALSTSDVSTYFGGGSAGITKTGSGTTADPFVYSVTSGYENRPADNICLWQAALYCNWLSNGQGSCDITTGAYTGIGNLSTFTRVLGGTKFYIPTSDEWYKAAYYDPTLNSGAGGYWQYPNMSNTEMTGSEANVDFAYGFHTIDVGSFPTELSYYGTLDQGGNLSEGTESPSESAGTGYFESWGGNYLFAAYYTNGDWNNVITSVGNYGTQGFRIVSATSAVPEPSTVLLTVMGLVGLMAYAWKKRK